MVTFLTLLLGVVWGPRQIDVGVPPGTAAVEIVVDGATAATRYAPPWRFVVDLGPAPAPHTLDAVAYGPAGAELSRARQVVNLPKPEAEAVLALLPGSGGRGRTAHLGWEAVTGPQPLSLVVTFDGKPIPAANPARIELPPFVPEQVHFLRASLLFPNGVRTEADLTFGGRDRDETSKELTAVAVRLPRGKVPPLEAMAGWLEAGGAPLRVVAAEEGDARVVFVIDADGPDAFQSVRASVLFPDMIGNFSDPTAVRTMTAYAHTSPGSQTVYDVYLRSFPLNLRSGLLAALAEESVSDPLACPRYADAATAAGLLAAQWSHPRALVLVLTGNPDASILPAEHARSFLADLGVPLFVWVVGPGGSEAAAHWGQARIVKTRAQFRAGFKELDATLSEQRILWIEGTHLPQFISVSATAPAGTAIAR
jgi:hypothetical protein